MRYLPSALAFLALGSIWASPVLSDESLAGSPRAAFTLNGEPATPIPSIVELDPRKQALGRLIFFNPRLSRDQETSCASCHRLPPIDEAQAVSGASEVQGRHDRSVPLLYNVSLALWLNWDGRYFRLENLLEGAFPALDKMNMEWHRVIPRIIGAYGPQFEAIYDGPPTPARVVEVLADFLRGLNTPNARFDRYLRGETEALTPREREGYALFKEIGCSSCHNGVMLGTNFFEEFYVYRHEEKTEAEPRLKDLGRYYVTADQSDRNAFRVPTLRNVALSAPYFHDGSAETLADAVEEMIEHQLGLEPDKAQIELLVAFLQTLTGKHGGVEP